MTTSLYDFMDVFRKYNVERAETCFKHPTDAVWWTNAIAGEAGEAANISKKISRGDFKSEYDRLVANRALAEELADVITYCDLLLASLGVRTQDALLEKFNKVSKRVGYQQVLF